MSKYLSVASIIFYNLILLFICSKTVQLVNGEGCADFGTPSQCVIGDPLWKATLFP